MTFYSISSVYSKILPATVNGWNELTTGTFTYSSTDAPTYVINSSTDISSEVDVGCKLRIYQSGSYKYFFVTAIGAFTGGVQLITLYGGGGDGTNGVNNPVYSVTSASIASVDYSRDKKPLGFPIDPTTWTYNLTKSVAYSTASTTYVELDPALQTRMPIGSWSVEFSLSTYYGSGGSDSAGFIALSSSTSAPSTKELLCSEGLYTGAAFVVNTKPMPCYIENPSKTTYYVIAKRSASSTIVQVDGSVRTTYIKYKCAYL